MAYPAAAKNSPTPFCSTFLDHGEVEVTPKHHFPATAPKKRIRQSASGSRQVGRVPHATALRIAQRSTYLERRARPLAKRQHAPHTVQRSGDGHALSLASPSIFLSFLPSPTPNPFILQGARSTNQRKHICRRCSHPASKTSLGERCGIFQVLPPTENETVGRKISVETYG